MRTQAIIDNVISNAKLIYSWRWQKAYVLKQRGLEGTVPNYHEVSNVISTIQNPSLSLIQKNTLADALVRLGYSEMREVALFSEEIFTDLTFDTV